MDVDESCRVAREALSSSSADYVENGSTIPSTSSFLSLGQYGAGDDEEDEDEDEENPTTTRARKDSCMNTPLVDTGVSSSSGSNESDDNLSNDDQKTSFRDDNFDSQTRRTTNMYNTNRKETDLDQLSGRVVSASRESAIEARFESDANEELSHPSPDDPTQGTDQSASLSMEVECDIVSDKSLMERLEELFGPMLETCDDRIQQHLNRCLKHATVRPFNEKMKTMKVFRNPEILEKIVSDQNISQFGTNFCTERYNPNRFTPEDFYDQLLIRSEKQQEQRVKNRTRIDFRSGNAQQSKSGSTSSSSAPGVPLSSGHSISAANPNVMLQRLQNATSNLHADTSRGSIPYLGNPGFPGTAYPGAAPILAPFNDANQMMPPMHSHIMRVSSTGSFGNGTHLTGPPVQAPPPVPAPVIVRRRYTGK